MKIIGITGPSGSGKTLLTEEISKLGIPTVNADELYHSMLKPPSECLDAIRLNFGDGVFNCKGELDRTALSKIVFSDNEKLNLLNATVLGMVLDKIRQKIKEFESNGDDIAAVDAPTLIESGFNKECDTVIAVLCPAEKRIARISERDGISREQATARIKAQKDDEFYINHSDYTVRNDGTEEQYAEKIQELINALDIKAKSTERKHRK